MKSVLLRILFVTGLWCLALPAQSQEPASAYPSRMTTVVVPFAAGSLADILGREIGAHLQAIYNQPFVVDNRAGASTLLAAKEVAKARPDGYTLMVPTVTTLSLAPQLLTKTGVDPLKDFTPIALLGATNFFLCVTPSFPARNMKEWIDVIRKNPGKYTYASSGDGSPHHIFMELLKKQLGLDILHVPYKGASGGMPDLLSGQVDMAFLTGGAAIANIKAGRLFGIGMSMAKRSVLLDSVPPIADTVPGFDWSGWMAFAGPANMPTPIVEKLANEITKMQGTQEYRDLLNKAAMEPLDPIPPAAMADFVKTEYTRWGPAIKASGASIN